MTKKFDVIAIGTGSAASAVTHSGKIPRAYHLPMVILCLLAFGVSPSENLAQVPVYEVTPVESTIKFGVESSVPIKGTFDKWNASLKLSSRDVRSAVLDIEIQADSVDTGSGMKNNKLKGKDFFNAKDSP